MKKQDRYCEVVSELRPLNIIINIKNDIQKLIINNSTPQSDL